MPSSIPSVSYNDAFKTACDSAKARKFIWQVDTSIQIQNLGKLVYLPLNDTTVHLAYKFDIYTIDPISRQYVYIDAQNNKVLKRLNRIYDTDYIGTAHTFYNGIQSITTNKTSVDRDYYLMEEGRSGLRVLDCKSSQFLSYAEKIKDFDNIWNDPDNYKNSCYDVHYSSEKTYDYFLESHNRNSLDNNGYRITSYVNFDYQLNNAFWDGEQVCYGSGDNIKYNPFTSTDIVAHELTHGITTFSANLNYEYESGALNESFSDIFSVCVDFYANPGTANWTNGEQVRIDHFPFRSIENPNLCDDPDTYNGLYWYAGSSDNGGVHTNSGVQNYWFYLLVNGGIGINDHGDPYNISGIGLEKAAQIAYRNLTVYLTPTSNYEDARTYSIQAAGDLFGECSNEAIQVTNAWNAVGVGAVFSNFVTANFEAYNTYNCSTPGVVPFIYTGSNGSSFSWDFGDGNISSLKDPIHTYIQEGVYTVNLNVFGDALCSDSNTVRKNNYLRITNDGPITPATENPQTLKPSEYGLYLFELEGIKSIGSESSQSYLDLTCSQRTTLTEGNRYPISVSVNPSYNETVHIWLDLNNNGEFDLIGERIYKSHPFCGNIKDTILIPQGLIYNIPLRMRIGTENSDYELNSASVSRFGQFEDYGVTIQQNPHVPSAQFTQNSSTVHVGAIVQFKNQSQGLNSSYYWTFEGGVPATSTNENPKVLYKSRGTYDVTLTATNSVGSNTVVKKDIITVTNECIMTSIADTTFAPSGVIYDPGGPFKPYPLNFNSTFVIIAGGSDSIKLTFDYFNIEKDWDFLTLDNAYNSFTGNYIPKPYVTKSDTLKIRFSSDELNVREGFKLTWQAFGSNKSNLNANFSISNSYPAYGETVVFRDESIGKPAFWQWDFGTDQILNHPNVKHQFYTPGSNEIILNVKNDAYSRNYSKFVYVQKPPALNLNLDTIKVTLRTDETEIHTVALDNFNGEGDLQIQFDKKPVPNNLGKESFFTYTKALDNFKNIVIGCAKQETEGPSQLRKLIDDLRLKGAKVHPLGLASTFDLDSIDILILNNKYLAQISKEKLSDIRLWLIKGGNIILQNYGEIGVEVRNELIAGSGITLQKTNAYPTKYNCFTNHIISTNLSEIELNPAYYCSIESPAVSLFCNTTLPPAAVSTVGKGRLIVLGNYFLNDYYYIKTNVHKQFAINCMEWLAGNLQSKWFDIEVDSVSILKGEKYDLDIVFDAKNLLGGHTMEK